MKKLLFTGLFLSAVITANAQTTLYTGNGTLSGVRTVTMGGKNLTFQATSGNLFINGTNGNVGINNTLPSEKLDITGNIKAESGYFTKSLANGQTFADAAAWIKGSTVISGGTLLDPVLGERTFQFLDFPSSNMYELPRAWFSISDRSAKSRLVYFADQGGASEFVTLDKDGNENIKIGELPNSSVFVHIPKSNSRLVVGGWGDYLTQHMFVVRGSSMIEGNILTDSNIGIGTNSFTDGSDSYRLSVDGAVRAHRVKVYTTWADYVFEKQYKLPTLEEVEQHIKDKGHLKDIPSAAEVEANGIELGEMNKLLLQKIEELTLYTIELNKEVKALKAQINKQ